MTEQPTVPYPNHLAKERLRFGIESAAAFAKLAGIEPAWYEHIEAGKVLPTPDEFKRMRAALGDIAAKRLYEHWHAHLGALRKGELAGTDTPNYAEFWGRLEDAAHLLTSRDEATWIDRHVEPDRTVDVYVNLSCGPQHSPHMLLDTVSVLEALGVNFAAASGRIACCGVYYRNFHDFDASERMNASSMARAVAWGAKTTAHWCTNCVNTYGMFERRNRLLGETPPTTQHLYDLLETTIRRLGDQVPWKRAVPAKVLIVPAGWNGPDSFHGDNSARGTPVHAAATETCARVLALVPGVEVIGYVDKEIMDVAGFGTTESIFDKPALAQEDAERRRTRLAELFAARGADTSCGAHFNAYHWWSRLASDRLSVRSPISLIADALGCAHPDRYQAAIKLGDPEAVLEQTRPLWTSWGMREERARELTGIIFNPAYAASGTACACGGAGGGCREELIDVDVLSATQRPRATREARI